MTSPDQVAPVAGSITGARKRVFTEKSLSAAVSDRRATPAFAPDPVPDEDLERIVRAGLEAPSSYNLQPWRFIVVRDAAQRRRLRVAADDQAQVEQVPVVIVVCADLLGWREDLDSSLELAVSRGVLDRARASRKRRRVTRELEAEPNILRCG